MARALGDERGLKVVVGDRAPVVEALGELECALDVLAGGFPVTLPPVAAGAPAKSVRAQTVGGEARALGEVERLAEERDGRRDGGKLVPADSEAVENLGSVDVAEGRRFGELAGCFQAGDRFPHLAEVHAPPGVGQEGPEL